MIWFLNASETELILMLLNVTEPGRQGCLVESVGRRVARGLSEPQLDVLGRVRACRISLRSPGEK